MRIKNLVIKNVIPAEKCHFHDVIFTVIIRDYKSTLSSLIVAVVIINGVHFVNNCYIIDDKCILEIKVSQTSLFLHLVQRLEQAAPTLLLTS